MEARSKLSQIVDHVAESKETYLATKKQKPPALIMGIDRYRELTGASKYLKTVGGKRIMNLEGMATADEAIRKLRESRSEAVIKKSR